MPHKGSKPKTAAAPVAVEAPTPLNGTPDGPMDPTTFATWWATLSHLHRFKIRERAAHYGIGNRDVCNRWPAMRTPPTTA